MKIEWNLLCVWYHAVDDNCYDYFRIIVILVSFGGKTAAWRS